MLGLVVQDDLEEVRRAFAVKVAKLMNYYQVKLNVSSIFKRILSIGQVQAWLGADRRPGKSEQGFSQSYGCQGART